MVDRGPKTERAALALMRRGGLLLEQARFLTRERGSRLVVGA